MTFEEAEALDAADPLRSARERFRLPEGLIYLDGNSLGALPTAAPGQVQALLEREWGEDLIAGWNAHGWINAPARIAARLAPLIGARPNELLIADSTSVTLFKLLAAAVKARPGRSTILSAKGNFPTDLYVAQGLARLIPGLELRIAESGAIAGAIDGDTAVVMLTHIDYRSAARFDMAAINQAAHASGALVLWDLSHSAGAVELDLRADNCDLAVGCGYKYLNGGPGAPAFLYVAEALQEALHSPISGWMGHADPFAFDPCYRPAPGIARFLSGTPSIVALAALEAGLATFEGIPMAAIESKGRTLSQLLIDEVEARCGQVRLASPRDPAARGSHVSFGHPQAYALMQALIERRLVGDFREPDLMRFGLAPLYTSHADVWRAAEIIGEVISSGEWDQPRFRERARVT